MRDQYRGGTKCSQRCAGGAVRTYWTIAAYLVCVHVYEFQNCEVMCVRRLKLLYWSMKAAIFMSRKYMLDCYVTLYCKGNLVSKGLMSGIAYVLRRNCYKCLAIGSLVFQCRVFAVTMSYVYVFTNTCSVCIRILAHTLMYNQYVKR